MHREVIAEQGVEVALLESARATSSCWRRSRPDTPVGRFLATRGPGLHHVAYRVADIDAALAALEQARRRADRRAAARGVRDSRIAFIHPRATGGVLTEIVRAAAVEAH